MILRSPPSPDQFTPAERRLIQRLRTPTAVQRFLNRLPYNTEPGGDTLRSFRQVARRRTAHCLEAALFAACVLEQHGYPPLLMGLESIDLLDHVIFVYRYRGKWGSVARSRDPGLHGRKPVFRSPRALAESYFDPYIDYTGRVKGYSVTHMRVMGSYDWRFSRRNVWAVERMLLDVSPSQDQAFVQARAPGAREIPGLSGETQKEAAVLPRTREVDGDSESALLLQAPERPRSAGPRVT